MPPAVSIQSLTQPFIDSTMNVISTMAFLDCEFNGQHAKTDTDSIGDMAGIIGLASDSVRGTMALVFPEKVILAVVSSMLGEEFTCLTDEVGDAIGEVANMVSGGARRTIGEQGISFTATIPSTIRGKCEIGFLNVTEPVQRLAFKMAAGPFWVDLGFSY